MSSANPYRRLAVACFSKISFNDAELLLLQLTQKSFFMAGIRNVVSTLTANGEEVMGPEILLWHYPDNNILNGSLLTVESNHFCVLKSRGAILNVYETGQYPIQTPDRPIFGSLQQAFYGGQSPWQYEALYINRSKLVLKTTGMALS